MLSQAAHLDLKVASAEIREFQPGFRGDAKAATRYLSALKQDCVNGRIAWQIYRAVKRQAKRMGLVPQ